MFDRSTAQILAQKSNLQGEKDSRSQIKIDKSQPRSQSRILEVGGATDYYCANPTPLFNFMFLCELLNNLVHLPKSRGCHNVTDSSVYGFVVARIFR